jgi:hypothetical protein
MVQVINGQPPAAAITGIPPVTLAPITWPTWAIEEGLTITAYKDAHQMQGKGINPNHWWHTSTLTDLHLWQVMAEMPADRCLCNQE